MKSTDSLCIVLALAGVGWLSQSAQAQPAPPADPPTPLVEIYGTLVPFVEYGATFGATRPGSTMASQVPTTGGVRARPRFVMDVGTSHLGFRGGIDLVDNLSVIWQIESGAQIDGTTVANTIASRNSNIGLTGRWGTLFFGTWDTPFKWAAVSTINPLRAGYISDYNGLLSGPGFGVATVVTTTGRVNDKADAAFERRQGNSIQYWTPNYNGLFGRFAYSINEGRTAPNSMVASIQPQVVSGLIAYDRGPIKLRYALEAHLDYFGMSQQGGSPGGSLANASSTDVGHRLIGSYTNAARGFDTRVVGVFEYLSYKNDDENPAGIDAHSRAAYYGLLDQTLFGKHHLWVGFGQAFDGSCSIVSGASCSTNGLGASMGVLGYLYRITKDTDFYAVGYRITNKSSASYNTFPPLGGPAAAGADVQAFGIGMVYQFSASISRGSKKAAAPTPAPVQPPPPPVQTPDARPTPSAPPVEPPADPAGTQPPAPVPAPTPTP